MLLCCDLARATRGARTRGHVLSSWVRLPPSRVVVGCIGARRRRHALVSAIKCKGNSGAAAGNTPPSLRISVCQSARASGTCWRACAGRGRRGVVLRVYHALAAHAKANAATAELPPAGQWLRAANIGARKTSDIQRHCSSSCPALAENSNSCDARRALVGYTLCKFGRKRSLRSAHASDCTAMLHSPRCSWGRKMAAPPPLPSGSISQSSGGKARKPSLPLPPRSSPSPRSSRAGGKARKPPLAPQPRSSPELTRPRSSSNSRSSLADGGMARKPSGGKTKKPRRPRSAPTRPLSDHQDSSDTLASTHPGSMRGEHSSLHPAVPPPPPPPPRRSASPPPPGSDVLTDTPGELARDTEESSRAPPCSTEPSGEEGERAGAEAALQGGVMLDELEEAAAAVATLQMAKAEEEAEGGRRGGSSGEEGEEEGEEEGGLPSTAPAASAALCALWGPGGARWAGGRLCGLADLSLRCILRNLAQQERPRRVPLHRALHRASLRALYRALHSALHSAVPNRAQH